MEKNIFIERSINVHGTKFDYSLVPREFKAYDKVPIICPKHGIFFQIACEHYKGKGCRQCKYEKMGDSLRITKDEFIKRSNVIHKNKYIYTEVEDFTTNKDYVTIICPKHGKFRQTVSAHLTGRGCKKCANDLVGDSKRSNLKDVLNKVKEIHGDIYDLSNVTKYTNTHDEISVICHKHGEFKTTFHNLLIGYKCPKCAYEMRGEKLRMSENEFKKRGAIIHNNKYIYDNVVYVDYYTEVDIICPIHGIFKQTPFKHLHTLGCPMCKQSSMENEVMKFLNEHGIVSNKQQMFDWLKDKNNMSLDFYLPKYNAAIECQGIQHFESVDFFGGKEVFLKTIERDKLKKQLCEEHGIKMFYFSNLGIEYPYQVYENLDEMLNIIKNNIKE